MATEKVRVYTEKHRRDSYRVMLAPGTLLWGGFTKKWAADGIAETLNAAFDKVEEEARKDEREKMRIDRLGSGPVIHPGEVLHS